MPGGDQAVSHLLGERLEYHVQKHLFHIFSSGRVSRRISNGISGKGTMGVLLGFPMGDVVFGRALEFMGIWKNGAFHPPFFTAVEEFLLENLFQQHFESAARGNETPPNC
jgi:hypothetical protein